MSVKLQTIFLVVFLALVDSLQAQTNSIYLRAEQTNRSASIRGRSVYQNASSKAIPGSFASRTRVGDDFVPDSAQCRRLRMPNACPGEHGTGLEMQVVARCVDVFAFFVWEAHTGGRLVGRLVFREANVAVDAKE